MLSDPALAVVAVDGPSGSGKSSASRGVAARLGLRYLDTGAMYRAITWAVLRDGVEVVQGDVGTGGAQPERDRRAEQPRADHVHPGVGRGGAAHCARSRRRTSAPRR